MQINLQKKKISPNGGQVKSRDIYTVYIMGSRIHDTLDLPSVQIQIGVRQMVEVEASPRHLSPYGDVRDGREMVAIMPAE